MVLNLTHNDVSDEGCKWIAESLSWFPVVDDVLIARKAKVKEEWERRELVSISILLNIYRGARPSPVIGKSSMYISVKHIFTLRKFFFGLKTSFSN